MAIRDILLFMASYPTPTPSWSIEASASLARDLGAKLSAALCQTRLPPVGNWLADKLVQASALIATENAKSRGDAQQLLAEFASAVDEGSRGEQILIDCVGLIDSAALARQARRHDLTIVPAEPGLDHGSVAEFLIFDSGRPVLLLPRTGGAGHRFDTVMVAWDGSRAAARALADALPFCQAAKSVTLLVVTEDKELDAEQSLADLQRHLKLHGVDADKAEIPARGQDAGSALMRHCVEAGADLLVMGAFGHSRMREFVLGGATRSVVDDPAIPVLLAH
jgi:nucleotide-binding universal stress UspA family protein